MADTPSSQLPVVRAVRPPYIEAFECFTRSNPDRIEAFVAYGLFVASEHAWATNLSIWPTEDMIAHSYQRLLQNDEVEKTKAAAKKIVEDHREQLVRAHEKKYLDGIFQDIEQRVTKISEDASTRHFWKGVIEAATGALVWSMFLIVATIIFQRIGVDVIEAYERASGLKLEHAKQQPAQTPAPQH
jgi:hypothetical protein